MFAAILRHQLVATICLVFAIALTAPCVADTPAGADKRDVALLSRMTLQEKINQLMLLSKGTMTGTRFRRPT